MADLGLNVERAISAVRDDEKKGKKKSNRNKDRKKRSNKKHYYIDKDSLGDYFQNQDDYRMGKNPGSSGSSKGSKSKHSQHHDRPFLIHEEYDDSEEDDSDDSDIYDPERSYRPRLGIRGDSRRRNVNARYASVTGNIEPQGLSIAPYLDENDYAKLLCGENYGVFIEPEFTGKKMKKKKKKERHIEITIIKHPYDDRSSQRRAHELSVIDEDNHIPSEELLMTSNPKQTLRRRKNRWPPPSPVSNPPIPTEKPPKMGFSRRVSKFTSGKQSSEVKTPKSSQLRKQVSKKQVGLLTGGFRKLAGFKSTTLSPQRTSNLASSKFEERFLVATNVPWVIPPPPQPKPPPPSGSDGEQIQLDFELLAMFCEDLRSTMVKLGEKHDNKSGKLNRLQREIEKADDEIASLIEPNRAQGSVADAITSQLKSVTTGKIFRVEKY